MEIHFTKRPGSIGYLDYNFPAPPVGHAENFIADFQFFYPNADGINHAGKIRAQG